MVNQFAQGDRYARRDLIDLAHKLGVELAGGHSQAIEKALETTITAEDAALIADFLKRQHDQNGDDLDQSSPQSDQAEPPDRNEEG